MKVPDYASLLLDRLVIEMEDCKMICLTNCLCLAYSYDIGIGCMTWAENLLDIQQFTQRGTDLYIRIAHLDVALAQKNITDPAQKNNTDIIPKKNPDLAPKHNISHGLSKNAKLAIVIISVLVGTLATSICTFLFWKKQRGNIDADLDIIHEETPDNPDQVKVFKFQELAIATNNFSGANMLGQGGFGQVYKGTLSDGNEIAVKRLSMGSIQGLEEFKNEVIVISKVQHRNLVRLLGCYPTKKDCLDWKKRFQIIEGISRGMLYLHRDSRLRVIHRDLKASNILLDEDLNPKISDFGMARIFGGDEQQASTRRVVGTLGYMPPEYVMDGRFSEKSDVFSFGVLLVEVMSGRKTTNNSTITPTKAITDSQTITSTGGVFKLGFFSPPNSTHRYVGIWYEFDPRQNIVWVANRDNPLKDSSGTLRIADDGNLVIVDGRGVVFWNTNVSGINAPNNSVSELLDTGNLEFRLLDESVWQSFDHPTHTFLPGMKIGGSTVTGKKLELTSWKSESDPSTGIFSLMLELLGDHPQLVVRRNGSNSRLWRSGPWNSIIFIGISEMTYAQAFSLSEDNMYISFKDPTKMYPQFVLDHHGAFLGKQWDADLDNWYEFWSSQSNICDTYGICGPFGSCNPSNSPICSCLIGFKPKFEDEWSKGNWSGGCVRNTQLECQDSGFGNPNTVDGFKKLESVKVPDNAIVSVLLISLLEDCKMICLTNCSCLAYSYDIGIGCMTWDENLVDIQQFTQRGTDLYIRLDPSDIDLALKNSTDHGLSKNGIVIIVIIAVLVGMLAISICAYFFWKWLTKQRGNIDADLDIIHEETPDNPDQVKVFKFQELAIATNNFSGANMLGQGGFGKVYKGTLSDGQEIAVKRLSKGSIQGLEEFKNEVIVISKVQHRNLVRLLGCCLEGEEKMLIYEYMPNKSLDAFLFDPEKRESLDWKKRFQIIEGISRGMLYLHRDSRLRVIHRDLKASNILLDEDLNPKISDFGMARIFGGNEQQASTRRVVGTLGYMSPEYVMDGRFSEKSDVFSFGVLLLEVVSGRKTTSFHHLEQSLSLLGYAWQLWNECKMELLIEPVILHESTPLAEIFRCIQVGLLCVQECARDRPTMSTTLSMLTSEIATLPTPKQPAFIERRDSAPIDSFAHSLGAASVDHLTITHIEGR
ncbi:hypothetical protein MKW92_029391 [Papaver armeniacum]|nr:hypothetical protein MKW92_029391 [Papaver armeniacum]